LETTLTFYLFLLSYTTVIIITIFYFMFMGFS